MKLFTKGLLLIAVPSAVELALLGVVFDTQQQTAQAAQWVTNSKQILYQSSGIVEPLLRQAARVRTGMVVGDPALIDRRTVWVELGDRLSNLDTLVADTPQHLGVELTERFEMPQHREERLVAVHLRAPTLFREGHKNSPEKELQETQRPHATTPGFARRSSIFYSIRQGRIHDDSTFRRPPLPARIMPNRLAARFRFPAPCAHHRLRRRRKNISHQ